MWTDSKYNLFEKGLIPVIFSPELWVFCFFIYFIFPIIGI